MKLLVILPLASVLVLARADAGVDNADSSQGPVSPELEARIVAAYSTRTMYTLTTTTATAVLTCRQALNAQTCQKRRKRSSSNYRALNVAYDNDSELDALAGTLDDLPEVFGDGNPGDDRRARIALTVWTTTSSTYTVTITSTNTSTTFSLSYFCTYPGVSYVLACP